MSNMRPHFQPHTYYHIYNRGFAKKTLFHDDRDFTRFMRYIEESLLRYPALQPVIYCILPNHFHLLLQNTSSLPDHTISCCLQRIQSAYANFYSTKYRKTPHQKQKWLPLFEGRFHAKALDTDEYQHQCYEYIRYNAQKHKVWATESSRPYVRDYVNNSTTLPPSDQNPDRYQDPYADNRPKSPQETPLNRLVMKQRHRRNPTNKTPNSHAYQQHLLRDPPLSLQGFPFINTKNDKRIDTRNKKIEEEVSRHKIIER
jgi:putative transposase